MKNSPIRSNNLIFLGLLISILGSGCTSNIKKLSYNAPFEGHLLAVDHKKDIKVSGSAFVQRNALYQNDSIRNKNLNLSLSAGYGLTQKLALQGTLFHTRATEQGIKGNLTYGSVASGFYFLKSKEKLKNDKIIRRQTLFDIYLGSGFGKINHTNEATGFGRSELSFIKIYLQGGLHFQMGKRLKFSGALRALHINYLKANKFNDLSPEYEYDLQSLLNYDPFFTFEFMPRLDVVTPYGNLYFTPVFNITRNDPSGSFFGPGSGFQPDVYPTRSISLFMGLAFDIDHLSSLRKKEK